ncbi:MAG: DUF3078 domain-containing protein [Paludibacteraceae bacterium]|nr:DUF3078 domain-containing protein [Paludibacteraceae bacterium]
MRKSILSVALCLLASLTMTAQTVDKSKVTSNAEAAAKAGDALKAADTGDKAWKFDGTVGLNAAATGLVNWAAGGKNNVNGIAYAKLHLLYHKNAFAWETNFDTDYGMTWIDQDEDAFQKSSDNIKLATKFGWEFKPTWYLTVMGSFQSQYALGRSYETGYNPIISKWLAPSYTDVSVGIDWKKSVNGADFSLYLSPIAGRVTTAYVGDKWNEKYTLEAWQALNPSGTASTLIYEAEKALHTDLASSLKDRYGVVYYDANGNKMYDRNARAEFGLSFKGAIAYTYNDFKIGTTLALFTPYAGKGYAISDPYFQYSNMNRHFGQFDVDWDVMMSYQFLKCLQVTLQTNLKYYPGTLIADKNGNLAERVQFKGVIGLGVGYSF